MSDYLKINPRDVGFSEWSARKVLEQVRTWGLLTHDSRTKIEKACGLVIEMTKPFTAYRDDVEVTPAKVKGILTALEKATTAVHSARKVMTNDRRRAMGLLAQAKGLLRPYIQLSLFGDGEPR